MNLITFSTDVRPFKDSLVNSGAENIAAAKALVEKIEAAGGTAIDEALKAALKTDAPRSSERPFMVVFITDGEPTIGERDPEKILANVKQENTGKARLFVFGVGHDLNTKLLDRLGDENYGTRDYIDEKEDIEVKISSFYKKISDPVLSDVELKFNGAESFDVYPKTWPDLFHGSELVVVGRYRDPGRHNVVLTGKRAGENMTWEFSAKFTESSGENEFLPRLWATRKIGYLMDEIRLHGEKAELKDEIVRLAKRHAIVTPYTSYLVVQEGELRGTNGQTLSDSSMRRHFRYEGRTDGFADQARSYSQRSGSGGQPGPAGKAAVRGSREALQLKEAAPSTSVGRYRGGYDTGGSGDNIEDGQQAGGQGQEAQIKQVGSKTFYREPDGRWVDSDYDGKAETKKVQAFSDDYFALAKKTPELGKYLALSQHLVVVLDKIVYEIQ